MFACRSTVAGDEIAPMSTQTSVDGGTEKDSYHSFEANDNAADAPQTPPPANPSSSSNAPLASTKHKLFAAKFGGQNLIISVNNRHITIHYTLILP